MCIRRVIAACSLAICLTIALAGCSSTKDEPTPTPTSTQAKQEYDLSRLSEVEDDMPTGFIPFPAELRKLPHVLVAGVGDVVANGKQFTVDPPHCAVLLKPVDGETGADMIGFRADGLEKRSIGVGADLPVTVPAEIPTTGCDRMSYAVPDDNYPYVGTAERIAAPDIDGAITMALKITMDGFPDPEYFYAAILDNRLFVDINARLSPDYPAQPLLPDLLVKAVAAIRGD